MIKLLLFLHLGFLLSPLLAEEPVRGPLPEDQQQIIHDLAMHHDQLVRTVILRENGYEATTTTNDPDLAAKLKRHFQYMAKRLDSGP